MPLGTFDRDDNLALLGTGTFDVLVVGGGITGAGVALDAAARGLRTALVERDDFASGTSSKSSKLVHGGLRYLQNGDVRLVYEALHERQRLLRNAPHLVKVLPFLIPVFSGKEGIIPKQVARALGSAMWMYDLTGGLRIGRLHKRLRQDAALRPHAHARRPAGLGVPLLRRPDRRRPPHPRHRPHRGARLRGGDRQPRPSWRRCDAPATGSGARWSTPADGTIDVAARVVVNATGVWADDVRALEEGASARLHPARQGHPRHGAVGQGPERHRRGRAGARATGARCSWCRGRAPTAGRRRGLGHLHRHHRHRLRRRPRRPPVHARGRRLPARCHQPLAARAARPRPTCSAPGPACARWSATRPTGRTADLSRRHHVTTSPGGMVTVTGGKLTTYREMAEDTVDAAVAAIDDPLPRRSGRSRTRKLRSGRRGLGGWPPRPTSTWPSATAARPASSRRWSRPTPRWREPLVPGLPYRGSRPSTRPATRWRPPSTTSCPAARGPGCGPVTPPRPPPTTWPRSWPASSAGREAERAAQVAAYRDAAERAHAAPGLPESQLGRLAVVSVVMDLRP